MTPVPFNSPPSGVFVHQDGQIVLQFDGTGNADLEYEDLSHRYLWGPVVDMLLADEQVDWSDTVADGPVYWMLADHLGTIRDVVDNDGELRRHNVFDSFGNFTGATYYDIYGEVIGGTNPGADPEAVQQSFYFTGVYRDPITGLQWNRARWYNPEIQRWMSEDPIKDGFNWQIYVTNAPTMYTDDTGLGRVKKLWKGLKVIVDNDTAEFVLANGKRIKIRNSKFIDSHVTPAELRKFTSVSEETIACVEKKYGKNISIYFDKFGQPDFSRFRKAQVTIPNPGASNYASEAWKKLKKDRPDLYKKYYRLSHQFNWHHAADGSLELIDKDLHTAFQHTGLNSVLKGLGVATVCAIVPGVGAFKEGRINDGAREVAVNATPLGWSSLISEFFSGLYDLAHDDIYDDGQLHPGDPGYSER
jgi:RHS repeat-associated protein